MFDDGGVKGVDVVGVEGEVEGEIGEGYGLGFCGLMILKDFIFLILKLFDFFLLSFILSLM